MEREIAAYNEKRNFFDIFKPQVYISSELGLTKPDQKVYKRMLEDLSVDPGEIVFIDDSPRNVEAAQRSEIEYILFSVIPRGLPRG